MKKMLFAVCSVLMLAACGNKTKATQETNENSSAQTEIGATAATTNVQGTYKGVLPAADGPGIETTLTLNADKTFGEHTSHLEGKGAFDEKGTYTQEGNLLTLKNEGGETSYYRIEENRLRRLTAEKEEVTGELADQYVLNKQ